MKGDKKKIVVLAVLALAIVAVGAFQFVSSGKPAPAPAAAAKTTPEEGSEVTKAEAGSEAATAEYSADSAGAEGENDPMKKLYAMGLSSRDPFTPGVALPKNPDIKEAPKPTASPVARPSRPWKGGGGISIPPMLPGNSFDPNSLNVDPQGGAPVGLPNVGPEYSVSGVIRGETNAAVIADSQGHQRFVREGQDLDGDTKVVSVQKGQVILRKKDGKTVKLNVGGNP
jgi:hypothetical protein